MLILVLFYLYLRSQFIGGGQALLMEIAFRLFSVSILILDCDKLSSCAIVNYELVCVS